jgi:pantetheine-phosphate adenylyltransferase
VAREVGADMIVKGLRVAADFEYELQQAQMNKAISGIQTLFIPCGSSNSFIASTLVKEIAKFGGADRVEQFVPVPVFKRLKEKLHD